MTDIYTKLADDALDTLMADYQVPEQTDSFNEIVGADEGRHWIFSPVENQSRLGYRTVETFKVARIFRAAKDNTYFVYITQDHSDEPGHLIKLDAYEAERKLEYALNEIRPRITKKRRNTGILRDLPTIYLEVVELLSRRDTSEPVETNKPIYIHPECHTTYDRYLTITGGVAAPSPVDIGEWRMIREIYPDGRIVTFCGRTCLPCDALNEKVLSAYFSTLTNSRQFYALVVDSQKEFITGNAGSYSGYPHHFYADPE
ncbi:TPA: hypothetical protein NV901_002009 [Escherichia coli]|nr:hypothetical protein [Escherichia coli]